MEKEMPSVVKRAASLFGKSYLIPLWLRAFT